MSPPKAILNSTLKPCKNFLQNIKDYIFEILDNIQTKMKSLINFAFELKNYPEFKKHSDKVNPNLFLKCLPVIF